MPIAYDVAVMGLGAMGSAAVYQLAKRGAKVLGLDRYAPPHEQGSTHGDTRVTRVACGEGPEYTPFALRSHEIWRELEAALGVELLTQNGLLVISGPGDRPRAHDREILKSTIACAEAGGIKHSLLDTAEIRARYPAFKVADGDQAYHDTVGGFVRPERCIAAQLQRARELGADLHLNEKVLSFQQSGGAVMVTTDKGTYTARDLIVSAGPWLPEFLDPTRAKQFRVTRQILYWFRARDAAAHAEFAPGRFPVFIWQIPAPQGIYGFPATGGIDEGIKVATEQDHVTTTPDTVARTASRDEIREMYEVYVGPWLPGLSEVCVKAKVCLYTTAPDHRFVIDRHPEHDRIIVASPCSGHGFKHSAAIGETLAQMALDETHLDVSKFSFERSLSK